MYGQYHVIERIAIGGMAEIYLGVAQGMEGFERKVVIKKVRRRFSRDRRFHSMLIKEAKITGSLSHPNIVQILDLGQNDKHEYFIVMEYVEGKDLRSMMDQAERRRDPLEPNLVLYIATEICAALNYAHRKTDEEGRPLNLIHRDVSPSNILVSRAGEVKLTDFGIARYGREVSVVGSLKGKLGYMSPEQARADTIDRRSDVFSLGAVLFEALLGRKVFSAERDLDLLDQVREARITRPTSIDPAFPDELERVLLRALAPDPDDRFQSAEEMAGAIREYQFRMNSLRVGPTQLAGLIRRLFPEEPVKRRPSRPIQFTISTMIQLHPPVFVEPSASGSDPGALDPAQAFEDAAVSFLDVATTVGAPPGDLLRRMREAEGEASPEEAAPDEDLLKTTPSGAIFPADLAPPGARPAALREVATPAAGNDFLQAMAAEAALAGYDEEPATPAAGTEAEAPGTTTLEDALEAVATGDMPEAEASRDAPGVEALEAAFDGLVTRDALDGAGEGNALEGAATGSALEGAATGIALEGVPTGDVLEAQATRSRSQADLLDLVTHVAPRRTGDTPPGPASRLRSGQVSFSGVTPPVLPEDIDEVTDRDLRPGLAQAASERSTRPAFEEARTTIAATDRTDEIGPPAVPADAELTPLPAPRAALSPAAGVGPSRAPAPPSGGLSVTAIEEAIVEQLEDQAREERVTAPHAAVSLGPEPAPEAAEPVATDGGRQAPGRRRWARWVLVAFFGLCIGGGVTLFLLMPESPLLAWLQQIVARIGGADGDGAAAGHADGAAVRALPAGRAREAGAAVVAPARADAAPTRVGGMGRDAAPTRVGGARRDAAPSLGRIARPDAALRPVTTGPRVPPRPPRPKETQVRVPVPAKAKGSVVIKSEPWAYIHVDGRNTGRTTSAQRFSLPVGRHQIELVNPALDRRQTFEIVVEEGREVRKFVRLE